MSKKGKNIVFFHPDLGIGGAERLVIDAAVGLQNLGHKITIFTSHCDPQHCFDEAKDGTLDVRVRGDNVIPPNILGRFAILCAILRQLHLVLQISLLGELNALCPDAFFIDQLSACIPFLRFAQPNPRSLFYCHFPDQLLASRQSGVKRIYRIPFDWIETWTTGAADALVVNSEFTKGVFGQTFPALKGRRPTVIYPCVDTRERPDTGKIQQAGAGALWRGKKVLLSINRFERKKNVELAVKAFAGLSETSKEGVRLVIAGGYDPRVQENVTYHDDLVQLATSFNLKTATAKTIVTALNVPDDIEVLFFLSVPASLKSMLLHAARLLIYTPANEHFGIVPLEAMLAGLPVLAANSGGPLETVLDGQTGWLRDIQHVEKWTDVMDKCLNGMQGEELQRMKDQGRGRVIDQFSESKMAERLDLEIDKMMKVPRKRLMTLQDLSMLFFAVGVFGAIIALGISQLWRFTNQHSSR